MVNPRQDLNLPFPWIDGLNRRQQFEIYEDFKALARQGTGTRWATLVIAASDSTAASKDKADYVCNGSNDAAQIQTAVDLLSTRDTPGRIVFLEGTYTLTAQIDLDIPDSAELVLVGMSSGAGLNASVTANCQITGPGSGSPAFMLSGASTASSNPPLYGFFDLSINGHGDNCIEVGHNNLVRLSVDHCWLNGSAGIFTSAANTTLISNVQGGLITNNRVNATDLGIGLRSSSNMVVANNLVTVSSGAYGISLGTGGGDSGVYTVTGNNVIGSSAGKGIYVWAASLDPAGGGTLVAANKVSGCDRGIEMGHMGNSLIHGNFVYSTVEGIFLDSTGVDAPAAADYVTVSGNYVYSASSIGIRLTNGGGGGPRYTSVVGNTARVCTTAFQIGSGALSVREIANDWGGLPTVDAGTSTVHASPGTDYDAVALSRLRKNSTGTVFERHRINLIEGAGVTLTVADDSVNDEVDVTIAAAVQAVKARKNSTGSTYTRTRFNFIEGTGITLTLGDDAGDDEIDLTVAATGAGATVDVRKNSTGSVYTRPRFNFIEGSNITLTVTDDAGDNEVDITIASTASGGGGEPVFKYQSFR